MLPRKNRTLGCKVVTVIITVLVEQFTFYEYMT